MNLKTIEEKLLTEQDLIYKNFLERLLPTFPKNKIIGVRMPTVRKIAKELTKAGEYKNLYFEKPFYLESKNLVAVLLNDIKNDKECIEIIDQFLQNIDNWSTCDLLRPKVFKTKKELLYPWIVKKCNDNNEYTIRLAIGFLHTFFLEDAFDTDHFKLILLVSNESYYVRMMMAWYMAEALVKQYESAIEVMEKRQLKKWIHNKSIQKARESFRLSDEKKEYLRSLCIK